MRAKFTSLILLGLVWGTVQAKSPEPEPVHHEGLENQVQVLVSNGEQISTQLQEQLQEAYGTPPDLESIANGYSMSRAVGDDCTDPIVVTLPADLPYSDLAQTTCGRLDDYNGTCLDYYDGGEDIIYELNVTADVTIDLLLTTTTGWTGMMVDDNCPGVDETCLVFDTASSGGNSISGLELTTGTYYLMIDTWPTPDCIPEFDLSITEWTPPPQGDWCGDPFDFPSLPGSVIGATTDNSDQGNNLAPDEWWEFTVTEAGDYYIELCNENTDYDTYMWLYTNECGTFVALNDDGPDCPESSQPYSPSEIYIYLTADTYQVAVEGYGSGSGNYELEIYRNTLLEVPDEYLTIQDAIDASYPGDTILIDGGRAVYREQLYITHSLDIIGAGMDVTTLEMPDVVDQVSFDVNIWTGDVRTIYAVIGIDGAGTVNIDGLTVDGRQEASNTSMYGVYYFDTDGAMTDCRITNILHPTQPGNQSILNYCATHSDGGSFDVEVSGCDLPNMQKGGLVFMGPEGNCVVSDNVVNDSVSDAIAGNGMQVSYGCTGAVTDNYVSGLYYDGDDWGSTGILLFECGDVTVTGGEVSQCQMGVNHSQWNWRYIPTTAPTISVSGVTVDECDWAVGTHLGGSTAELDITITDCFLVDGEYSSVDIWGSDVDPWGGGYYAGWTDGILNAEVHNNYMSNGDGIVEYVELSPNTVNISAHNNSFATVGDYGVYNNYSGNTINAENNWWGDAAGPTLVPMTDFSQQARPLPRPVLTSEERIPGYAVDRSEVAGNQRTGVNVSPYVDFDPWFLTDGYQLNQTADVYHISVEDPGVQTPEHDPLQYLTTVTYDLQMATPSDPWRTTTAFIAYDPLVLEPVSVDQIYDPAGSADHLMSNLNNNPDGMLEITWYLTGITDGVLGGHTLFSVTFDGLSEDVNPGTVIHLDQVVMRDPWNQPLTAVGGSDININVDDTAPTPFVVTPPGNANINADPTIHFDATDNVDLHRITCEIVGYGWDLAIDPDIAGTTWSGNWVLDVSGIPDGDYTVNFRCWDDVGYYTDGDSWDFHLDTAPPTPPADLTAAPRCGMIHLEWTAATEHDYYELWREKRVPYPYFYDYGAGTGGLPPASGTYTTMMVIPPGDVEYEDDWGIDEFATRAVYDYKLVAVDSINTSAESGSAASTNYYLGDWNSPYDCNVGSADLAALSIYYGTISQQSDSDELDVAPTSDWGRFGLPGPDGLINFEDLIVMAMNYRATGPPIPFDSVWLLAKGDQPVIDGALTVTLQDEAEETAILVSGGFFAVSVELTTDRELISARADNMLVLTYATETGWMVDLAAMGDLAGETEIELLFGEEQEPVALEITGVDARDGENNSLAVTILNSGDLPDSFNLAQNYPNPFNPVTTITYDLAERVPVELVVFNSLGQQVMTLVDETQPAGCFSVSFDGTHLASGLYFYAIKAGEFSDLKKMLLVK